MTTLARVGRAGREAAAADLRDRRRHLRLVRKPLLVPRRRKRVLVGVLVVAVAVVVFGIALIHVFMAQSAFELQRQQQLLAERQGERESLELAVALLEAPDRVRREAVERLGMVAPEAVRFMESEEEDDPGDDAATETAREPRAGGSAPPDSAAP